MRLSDLLVETVLTEEAAAPTIRERHKVVLSLADIYDMTGQPYPTVKDPKTGVMIVPDSFYEPREFGVGIPDANGNIAPGSLDPKLVQAYDQWVAGGKAPGLLYDESTGEMRPYNENSYLEDFAWEVASGTSELAANLSRGTAIGLDTAFNFVGLYDGRKITRAAEDTWMDDFADQLSKNTDLEFRDKRDIMANAVTEPGDLLGLFYGESSKDLSWAGFGAMYATELPSTIVDFAAMSIPYVGTGVLAGLNAAEASGAAIKEIRDSITRSYDNGALQETNAWKAAMVMAEEQLRLDGELGGDPEIVRGKMEALAIDVLADNTYTSAIPAVAASGLVLDTISDRMIMGKIKPTAMRRAMARILIAPQVEGIDEGIQDLLIQRGLLTQAGDVDDNAMALAANADWSQALNAYYQGVVIGKAEAGIAQATDTIASTRAGLAKMRQFFYGKDAGNLETIIDVSSMTPAELYNSVLNEEGRLKLKELYQDGGAITSADQLSAGQRRQLSRRGRTTVDGVEITRADIERNARNAELMGIIDSMHYNPKENRYEVNFESEEDIREAARLLGVDGDGSLNSVMKGLEDVTALDFRIEGRSNLEAPSWVDLSPAQKADFVNKGYVDFADAEGARQGQRWTRDQVEESSRRYGNWDQVPDSVKDLVTPTDARPVADADFQREISSLQAQIDSHPVMRAARRDLQSDQEMWDEEYGDDPDNAPEPRPTEDMPGDPYNFTGARAATSFIKRQIDQMRKELKDSQDAWDTDFAATHNRNGTPRVDKGLFTGDDQDPRRTSTDSGSRGKPVDRSDDAETDDAEADVAQPKDVTTVAPNQPTAGSDVARGTIVYNGKLRLAAGQMDPASVRSMIENLEKTYPGIGAEILGPGGIDNYIENYKSVEEFARRESQTLSQPVPQLQKQYPRTGTEITRDGVTYRFLGRMWAPVKEDGTVGSTGAVASELQQSLSKEALSTYDDVPVVSDDAPVYQAPKPEAMTTAPDMSQFEPGDTVTYTNQKGETRDAELVRVLPNGKLQVTLNGATYAIDPPSVNTEPPAQSAGTGPEVPTTGPTAPTGDADGDTVDAPDSGTDTGPVKADPIKLTTPPTDSKPSVSDTPAAGPGTEVPTVGPAQPTGDTSDGTAPTARRTTDPDIKRGAPTAPTKQTPKTTEPNTGEPPAGKGPKVEPAPTAPTGDTDGDTAPPARRTTDPKIKRGTGPKPTTPSSEKPADTPEPSKVSTQTTTQRPKGNTDGSVVPSMPGTQDTDIKRDQPAKLQGPKADERPNINKDTAPDNQAPDAQTDVEQPKSDTQVTPDDFTTPQDSTIEVPRTMPAQLDQTGTKQTDTVPDASTVVAPVAIKKTGKKDTKTSKKARLRPAGMFGLGGGRRSGQDVGAMMQFNPINIKDPLNLKQTRSPIAPH